MKKPIVLAIGIVLIAAVLLLMPTVGAELVDNDKDLMDDTWEANVGLNATNANDANYDPDNDGFTNIEEFNSKTDPFDPEDHPYDTERLTTTQAMVAIGGAISIGIAGIASAMGIGIAGAAAVGATTEKPKKWVQFLILQALPMTQGVYGLLGAILLFLGIGLLGAAPSDAVLNNPAVGYAAIGIGLAIGLTGISAVAQGMTAAAGISGTARNPGVFAKSMIYSVMSETLAIFGLLVGILIMVGVGLL